MSDTHVDVPHDPLRDVVLLSSSINSRQEVSTAMPGHGFDFGKFTRIYSPCKSEELTRPLDGVDHGRWKAANDITDRMRDVLEREGRESDDDGL